MSEGLADAFTTTLTQVKGLRVVSRNSVFRVWEQNADVSEIGQRLDVGHVLEGSVRTAGKRVRVSVQLIDAVNGFQIWSESYDREMRDIFAQIAR